MPSRARVDEFIAAVCTGDHADAIARFYTESATMQDNAGAPRVGREGLVARERKVLESVASTRRVDEIAMQEWDGDRIARERFVYDSPACGWVSAG